MIPPSTDPPRFFKLVFLLLFIGFFGVSILRHLWKECRRFSAGIKRCNRAIFLIKKAKSGGITAEEKVELDGHMAWVKEEERRRGTA